MLVGIWFGLYWVLFSFFDHYIQSSVQTVLYCVYFLLSSIILVVGDHTSTQLYYMPHIDYLDPTCVNERYGLH